MQFVIWGLGRNGKILYEMLGKDRIIAYIDSNEKYLGGNYNNIPVISLEEYKRAYIDFPIIISAVAFTDEISKVLLNQGVKNYYCYQDELQKIRCLYLQVNQEQLINRYDRKKRIVIIGTGLYSLLLYEFFIDNQFTCYVYESSVDENLSHKFNIKTISYEEVMNTDYLFCTGNLSDLEKSIVIDTKGVVEDFNQIVSWSDLLSHPELSVFKNIHSGERCFIIGTGPSLRMEDLNKLEQNQEYCIGVNGIFKGFERTNWRPNYYIISDPAGTLQWKYDIEKMEKIECFVADVAYFFKSNMPHIHKWHIQVEMADNILPQFSSDFSMVSYCGDTITYDGALQLASYMGFSEIYLIGIDCCQYPEGRKQHFVEDYQREDFKNAKIRVDKQMLAYQSAKSFSKRNGINIYNATRGGQLEVFERVDFDTLFEE